LGFAARTNARMFSLLIGYSFRRTLYEQETKPQLVLHQSYVVDGTSRRCGVSTLPHSIAGAREHFALCHTTGLDPAAIGTCNLLANGFNEVALGVEELAYYQRVLNEIIRGVADFGIRGVTIETSNHMEVIGLAGNGEVPL